MNITILIALLLIIFIQPSPATSPAYRVQVIVSNGDGAAFAVNDAGDVAGQLNGKAFIWHHGRVRVFQPITYSYNYLGGDYQGKAKAINRYGVAGGSDGAYFPCSMSGLEFATAAIYDSETRLLRADGRCSYEVDGINDAGTLVGIDGYRGFIRYADGKQIQIQPLSHRPEWNGTRASAIDNRGRVVGGTTIDVGPVKQVKCGEERIGLSGPIQPTFCPDMNAYVIHAFVATFDRSGQHMRDLGALPGYPDTYATAIAEDGTIVGYSGAKSGPKWTRVSGPSHAWKWDNGHMSDLGPSSSEDSYAYGVNNRGIVVGCAGDDAVRWVKQKMENLNALIGQNSGWHLQCAYGINRSGVIVGQGVYQSNTLPFRLVPLR
jgi:probable HAF family extracellular repeat protein